MQRPSPDANDIEMFDNGVLYMKVHFVTVPLTHHKTYEEVVSIAQMYNVVNINKVEAIINVMFANTNDARSFAKKVNEQ